MRYLLLSITLLLSLITINAEASNLISNGDFSNGLTGWSPYNSNFGESADQPRVWIGTTGTTNGVAIIQGSTNSSGAGLQQTLAIGADDHYVLTLDYGYTNIGSTSGVVINYLDASQQPIAGTYYSWGFKWDTAPDPQPADVVYTNSSWHDDHLLIGKAVTFSRVQSPSTGISTQIPQNAAYIVIKLAQYYTGYRTYFDNVSFEPVTDTAYAIDTTMSQPFYPAIRGQNVKTTGTADIEEWYNGRTLELSNGSSIRGVAGGLEADTYNWKDRTGRDVGSSTTGYKGRPTLEFLKNARDYNCEPLITVNVRGTGTGVGSSWQQTNTDTAHLAQLAADWVRYCNYIVPNIHLGDTPTGRDADILNSLEWSAKDPNAGNIYDPNYPILLSATDPNGPCPKVTYWEIGNEPKAPITGYIEPLPVQDYVTNYKAITAAMLAEDPTIKVGPCFTNPVHEEEYYNALLSDPDAHIDFISYHTYQNRIYSDYTGDLTVLEDYLDDSIKTGLVYNKGLNLDIQTDNGRTPVELMTSEYNPAKISTIRDESIYQAHALACAEYLFTYAEMNLRMAQYWTWPIKWDDLTVLPVAKMYDQASLYMGNVIVDSKVEDNFRLYTTKNTQNGNMAVWALNFSETAPQSIVLELQNLNYDVQSVTRYTLCHKEGTTSLLSYNSSPDYGTDRQVGWQMADYTDADMSYLPVSFAPATISVLVFESDLPDFCGDTDTVYFSQDFNTDCYIDVKDLSIFSNNWLNCNDPTNPDCQ